jgi:hypothetical protein
VRLIGCQREPHWKPLGIDDRMNLLVNRPKAAPIEASWAEGRGGSMSGSNPDGSSAVSSGLWLRPRDAGRLGGLADVCDARKADRD